MGLAASRRDVDADSFAAVYPRLRNICDLDGLERLGDPWANCEGLRAGALQGVLRHLLSEANDAESAYRLAALHRFWGNAAMLEAACTPLPALPRRRRSKLRIGLLSSDLCDLPVGRLSLPWLDHYDRGRFEIIAFASEDAPGDAVRDRIRANIAELEQVGGCSLRETAERIRAAEIDILLELNGHTEGTRLAALAYRTAPVQITWLGYQFSTGLPAVDRFLMDANLEPTVPRLFSESPLMIAGSWVCYHGSDADEPASLPPMAGNGFVTFGTLGHPFKYTRMSFVAWAKALHAVPGSRFRIVRPEAGDPAFRANVVAAFAREGIDRARVSFFDNAAAAVSHFTCYGDIDIALDTVPVAGGTTTADALWMGVPVVGLAGPALHQRLGLGLLSNVGLGGLCAQTIDDFGRIAAALAGGDLLKRLRRELRGRVRTGVLGDAVRFARNFDAALTGAARERGLL